MVIATRVKVNNNSKNKQVLSDQEGSVSPAITAKSTKVINNRAAVLTDALQINVTVLAVTTASFTVSTYKLTKVRAMKYNLKTTARNDVITY